MRSFTLTELFCLARNELFALHASIIAELEALPEGSADHEAALENLRRIRRALARSGQAP